MSAFLDSKEFSLLCERIHQSLIHKGVLLSKAEVTRKIKNMQVVSKTDKFGTVKMTIAESEIVERILHTIFVGQIEPSVKSFIKSFIPESERIRENIKILPKNQELDIYLPDKEVAIEVNEEYWHGSNKPNPSYYHLNKMGLCKSRNINLGYIWEMDWLFHRDESEEALYDFIQSKGRRIHPLLMKIETNIVIKRKGLNLSRSNGPAGFDSGTMEVGLFAI